jgi:hypothetical protein
MITSYYPNESPPSLLQQRLSQIVKRYILYRKVTYDPSIYKLSEWVPCDKINIISLSGNPAAISILEKI